MLIFFNIQLKTYLFFAGYLTLERLYSSTVLWKPCQPSSRQHQVLDNVLVQMQPWNMTTGAWLGALALNFSNFELFNLDEMSFLNLFDRIFRDWCSVVDQYNGIIDTGRIISRGTVSGIGEQIATNAWCSPGPWPKPYIFPLELRPSGAEVSCQEVFQAGHLSCWTAPNSPIRDPSQNCPSGRRCHHSPWLENQPRGNFRWENPHILCFGNLWNLQNPFIFPEVPCTNGKT